VQYDESHGMMTEQPCFAHAPIYLLRRVGVMHPHLPLLFSSDIMCEVGSERADLACDRIGTTSPPPDAQSLVGILHHPPPIANVPPSIRVLGLVMHLNI
jgi:hypothetical protein